MNANPLPELTDTQRKCSQCHNELLKVKWDIKGGADYFLSCDELSGGCGTVGFLNLEAQEYEFKNRRQTTTHCPCCGQVLA